MPNYINRAEKVIENIYEMDILIWCGEAWIERKYVQAKHILIILDIIKEQKLQILINVAIIWQKWIVQNYYIR